MVNADLISDVIPGRAQCEPGNLEMIGARFPDVHVHIEVRAAARPGMTAYS
jgi:hypothetical protein